MLQKIVNLQKCFKLWLKSLKGFEINGRDSRDGHHFERIFGQSDHRNHSDNERQYADTIDSDNEAPETTSRRVDSHIGVIRTATHVL